MTDQDTMKRRVLSKVYALLLRSVGDQSKAVNLQPLDGDKLSAERLDHCLLRIESTDEKFSSKH